jgi:hypothetical protein
VAHVLQDIRNSRGNKLYIYLFNYDGLSHHPDHDMLPMVVNGIIRILNLVWAVVEEEEVRVGTTLLRRGVQRTTPTCWE